MKLYRIFLSLFATCAAAQDALVKDQTGTMVYDTANNVTWLANFNLAATERFGLSSCDANGTQPCVNPSGSMTWQSAQAWIRGMNVANYQGHNNWQLPTAPAAPWVDNSCSSHGFLGGSSFAFGCTASAMGSLYHIALGLNAPDTAVPIVNIRSAAQAPFHNFQPYLYWSNMVVTGTETGHGTFSFNNGSQGSNANGNFLYVLPMIQEPITPPLNGQPLQLQPRGDTVYDPLTNATWVADANLAATNTFGLPRCAGVPDPPVACVNGDGSMTWDTANQFIDNMKAAKYLGRTTWQLPPIDPDCDSSFNCRMISKNNRMGVLYYLQFHLTAGTPVVTAPNTPVGPFENVQPYLYWGCNAAAIQDPCVPMAPPPGLQWSFSFGNGFQGTDVVTNMLYVTAYFPGAPAVAVNAVPR